MPIFNCLQRPGLIRHLTSTFEPSQTRSQAFDPSNHGIKSDLHFVIKGSHLFVCEGKRPGVNSRYDFEKTSLEMKDAIDHGVGQGKRLMTVFGCQVKDGKGELFRMELKSESIYLMKPVGSFVHPDGNDDMTRVLLHNLPLLLWLSVRASEANGVYIMHDRTRLILPLMDARENWTLPSR
ncbi:hypothetical protein B0O80DRAFT_307371 [Mortierella sp. GBAus27b]|nr:hypothetical protein B0O80DRAFT_307371 [Mortierella sp. GBAus27b]